MIGVVGMHKGLHKCGALWRAFHGVFICGVGHHPMVSSKWWIKMLHNGHNLSLCDVSLECV
jgi:hypothetical protein